MMFQQILVPLDGSPLAEGALPVTVRLARISGGTITLLQVADVSYAYLSYGVMQPAAMHAILNSSLANASNYLDALLRRPDLAGVTLKKQVVLGNPATVILSMINTLSADLVVMSSHGYTGVKRWVLGSVAEKVVHHAPVPVLILRDEKPLLAHPNGGGANGVRALIPLDASARSQDVIAPAAALVAALSSPGQGELHLTQMVMVPKESSEGAKSEALLQNARQNLQATCTCIREGLVANVGPELRFKLTWSVSVERDIAEGIVRVAEDGERAEDGAVIEPCDLIAMTTHGYSGIKKWTMGSIAGRVLQATRLPLLLVRPADMIRKEHLEEEGYQNNM
ncbi:universal stress protein UspA [Ktedonobacter sp. SOSP1-85]|uniref:universal stress protein n=1 Tax=Ktedonobacter sp. SOSP1-85 TaxID=2778367 RepID=UPI00191629BC|nr:universal stress protein [Ktedonobacter sp. SOSP1-85]GHO80191.1 universal stress protein UspA [Ktedonobacter sp. SOSP1-85]